MDSIRVGREEEFRVLVKQLEDINDSYKEIWKGTALEVGKIGPLWSTLNLTFLETSN